jgi:hypothetical protein
MSAIASRQLFRQRLPFQPRTAMRAGVALDQILNGSTSPA